MTQPIRFALVLHNHQPIGNFDHVFEQAYVDSYRPFLDVFEPYANLRISLHTSGPLLEWLDANHPEYLDRLARLVAEGRVEIIGGAYYEAILTMIPPADRIGQIRSFTRALETRLGATVQGMWIPERVWEQSMTRDIVDAGIRYTLVDDFHFKNAGLDPDSLYGYYITEDDGRVLSVFPGSEPLRYLIPFRDPEETISYLGRVSDKHPGAVLVFGDDGEKFGTWPDTKKHVYDNGWLRRFFDLLSANEGWIRTATLAESVHEMAPLGKVYLPEGSYREMTEWALPTPRILEFDHLKHELEHEKCWDSVAPFVRGGFWRNFKVKYPDSDDMYSRMMTVSRRLEEATRGAIDGPAADRALLEQARTELYRGQCNCSYWHGAFGGIYLPHLRNAVYRHLILADNLLDRLAGRTGAWVEATADDYNLDGRSEVRLAGDKLLALLAPAVGGRMYELDVRAICHNALATLWRRPEAYHEKVLAGPAGANGQVVSIHDRVVFKQENLDERLQYDNYSRKSLIDHFLDHDATLDAAAAGVAHELGDFVSGLYEAKIRRQTGRVQVQLRRQGNVEGHPVTITKAVGLVAGSSILEIEYALENLPTDRQLHFGVELNFSGMPSGADDRYFYDHQRARLGQLGQKLDLRGIPGLGLIDEWLGLDVGLSANRPTDIWTFPLESVSQSEGGFEAVHQSVVVMPHWHVQADAAGHWSVAMNLSIDTSLAESRMEKPELATVPVWS